MFNFINFSPQICQCIILHGTKQVRFHPTILALIVVLDAVNSQRKLFFFVPLFSWTSSFSSSSLNIEASNSSRSSVSSANILISSSNRGKTEKKNSKLLNPLSFTCTTCFYLNFFPFSTIVIKKILLLLNIFN